MSDRPLEPEDLGDLADLPPDDPRRRALESQPHARAQLHAYRDFVAPGDMPEGARVAEAEARLAETLEREIGVTISEDERSRPDTASAARPTARAPRPRARGSWSWLPAGLQPALAVAALIVVAGGALLMGQRLRDTRERVLRGATPGTGAGIEASATPHRLPDGTLRLEWSPAPEALSYSVVFLSPELTEVARVTNLGETHLDLRAEALPSGLQPGGHVLWRVLAMHGADEVSRSHASPLTLPQ